MYLKGLQIVIKVDAWIVPNKSESGSTIKRGPKYLGQGGTYFENEGLYLGEANNTMPMVHGRARYNLKIWMIGWWL